MTSELEPGSGGGDVVRGALALDLDEDGEVRQVLAVPLVEGREELEPVRGGGDVHCHFWWVEGFTLYCVAYFL